MSKKEKQKQSQLEQEFLKIATPVLEQINAKLKEASKLLLEAEKLSDEHGIPFGSNISPLSQSYFPNSFREKFPDLDLDSEEIQELVGYSEYYEGGWEHSAVCW